MKYYNKSDFGKKIGVTKHAVDKLIENGVITCQRDGMGGYLIAEDQIDAYNNNKVGVDYAAEENLENVPSASRSLTEWRAEKEKYTALLKKAEYEKFRGTLIEKAEVEQALFEFSRNIRDAFLSFPERFAAVFASQAKGKTPDELHDLAREVMTDEITKIINTSMEAK